MNEKHVHSTLSLRTRLVLSYLLVILGTVLVLSIVVSFTAQNYYAQEQEKHLNAVANAWSQSIQQLHRNGDNGEGKLPVQMLPDTILIYVNVADVGMRHPYCLLPASLSSNCNNNVAQQALAQSLQGQSVPMGTINISTEHGDSISSLYVSTPVKFNDQIIGALFVSEPQLELNRSFLAQINRTIVITGLLVAMVAGLVSFWLVRRLIRPLEHLTTAAEKMKQGQYTQRVEVPETVDELGQLGITFNEMADTIAADVNELRQQDQMRRDLIANIAHDLATPLTAIQGYSEALADNVITEPMARQETAQLIGREVQRLRRLVADVGQMTSIEAGRIQLDLAPLDMHTLADETVAVIEPECEQQAIAIFNKIVPGTASVMADSDRITQVLLNLLDNARRHTPAGGQIKIGAQVEEKLLRIWVSDTGSGIEPVDLPHIFERFYRADRARTVTTAGSGLGLSIVKAIIGAHGGKIWADSTKGQGTRITFTLPMAKTTEHLEKPALQGINAVK